MWSEMPSQGTLEDQLSHSAHSKGVDNSGMEAKLRKLQRLRLFSLSESFYFLRASRSVENVEVCSCDIT